MRTALISGAGVAGSTLAYWLAHHGWRTTVVERSGGQRSSGNPVDVRGAALPVVERMRIVPRLREAATDARSMLLIGADGTPAARLPMSRDGRDIELPRADLAAILHDAAAGSAEFRYDDSITALHDDGSGVDVTFERGAGQRFDVVIGADGLHSTVRRLTFGLEEAFVRHLGVNVATMPYDRELQFPHDAVMFNAPGRLAAVHPSAGRAMAAFIFRGGRHDGPDPKPFITHAYAGLGWQVPALLEMLDRTPDLYFDGVSRVRMPAWSRGRVALLGDAASCVSLFGDGSSLAIAGAHTLAAALAGGADPAAAFTRYEREHRRLTGAKQRAMHVAAALVVPRTRLGLGVRNTTARVVLARGRA